MRKPSPEFFPASLSRLGQPAGAVAVIGHDSDTDIGATPEQGITAILVETRKFGEDCAQPSKIKPDPLPDSIVDCGVRLEI